MCVRTVTDRPIGEVAERSVDGVLESFVIDGREVFVTASVGSRRWVLNRSCVGRLRSGRGVRSFVGENW